MEGFFDTKKYKPIVKMYVLLNIGHVYLIISEVAVPVLSSEQNSSTL